MGSRPRPSLQHHDCPRFRRHPVIEIEARCESPLANSGSRMEKLCRSDGSGYIVAPKESRNNEPSCLAAAEGPRIVSTEAPESLRSTRTECRCQARRSDVVSSRCRRHQEAISEFLWSARRNLRKWGGLRWGRAQCGRHPLGGSGSGWTQRDCWPLRRPEEAKPEERTLWLLGWPKWPGREPVRQIQR